MHVAETPDAIRVRQGTVEYYFCSEACRRLFVAPHQELRLLRIYAGLWHAVRARAANMDTLIALGTTTAFVYSAAVALGHGRYGHDVYFDTSVLIIAFILLGRSLEHDMKQRATASLRALVALQ